MNVAGARKLATVKTAPEVKDHDDHDHDDDGLTGHSHKKAEEGEGPWLVSYADLMTLLMGFFALLASMSTINPEAVEKVKATTSEAFGVEYKSPYEDLGNDLKKFIEGHGMREMVELEVTHEGVRMTFRGTLFFDSGSFIVKKEAQPLFQKLAAEIKSKTKPYKILVEGHTDSVPISHDIIASNWELSGLRAARIAQLFENQGFTRDLITIIGWGDTKPVVPDRDANGQFISEGLTKNRRVSILVSNSNKESK